jgi:hypothetical protein
MGVILQTWCQIERTSSSLRYVKCGPEHIQWIYRSAYSGLNIRLNASELLLKISRQFNERYTANLVPNIAHILQFTLCELYSRPYTMQLQPPIFRLQYSSEKICAAIGDTSTMQCALHCKHGAKYSAHPPVFAMWTVVPDIYNVDTARHIQTSIFNWTYLRCYWGYHDNLKRVIMQIWCHISHTPSRLHYVNCGPGHIQCNYSTAYSGFNIQLNVSALLLEISRTFIARYAANMVPNTAHILQFTQCELWFRTYTMCLQHRIFRLQYSTEGICAAIGDNTTIKCASCCKLGAKYSAHTPANAMWTVVPVIYNVFTAPHIQTLMFNWMYLRSYWRYRDNSLLVKLQTWCPI